MGTASDTSWEVIPADSGPACAYRAQLPEPVRTETPENSNRMSYAGAGGPNQVVSASASPSWVRSPTQATCPSGRISAAAGAVTAASTGSSHGPTYSASIS